MSAPDAGQRSERSDTTYRRDEHGKFTSAGAAPGGPGASLSGMAAPAGPGTGAGAGAAPAGGPGDSVPQFSSLLSHVEHLEKALAEKQARLAEREKELERASLRIDGFTKKNRTAMESALNTMMTKWMNAVKTDDEKVKSEFKCGMEKLASEGDDQNGVRFRLSGGRVPRAGRAACRALGVLRAARCVPRAACRALRRLTRGLLARRCGA